MRHGLALALPLTALLAPALAAAAGASKAPDATSPATSAASSTLPAPALSDAPSAPSGTASSSAPSAPSGTASASAPAAPAPPSAEDHPRTQAATFRRLDDRDSLFFVKASLSSGFVWGSRLVGYGSRERYTGATGTFDVEVVRLPWRHVGFELAFRAGYVGVGEGPGRQTSSPNFGRIDLAVDGALVRTRSAALLFGLGLGGDFSDRYWFGDARGYPFAIVRGRIALSDRQALHASWQFVPVMLASRSAMEQRAQLDWSYDMFGAGLRFSYAHVGAGEPHRDFPDYEVGLALSFVLW